MILVCPQWIRDTVSQILTQTLNLVPAYTHFTNIKPPKSEMATFSFSSISPLTLSYSSSSSSSKLSTFHAFRASTSEYVSSQHTPRREFLKGLALMPLPLVVLREPPPSHAREVEVGSFLPPSPSDPSFVLFTASPKDTPALRAGTWI